MKATKKTRRGSGDSAPRSARPSLTVPRGGGNGAAVGAARRARMRARLIEAAFVVFSRHGVEATVIGKVIRAAGVSRGTFYNYFRTNEELFEAVAHEVSNELLRLVDPIALREEDAAGRLATGIRLVMRLARAQPILARFLVRGGLLSVRVGGLATEAIRRDVALGVAAGRFTVTEPALALDLVLGPVLLGFYTLLEEPVSDDHDARLAAAVLRALGVPSTAARRLSARPLEPVRVPEGSLFARARTVERGSRRR